MYRNGAQVYKKLQVTTANPTQLVVQLYEGAVCFLERAILAMERRDIESAHHGLVRAQDIILHLRGTLNLEAGPLAVQLADLYDYFWRRLLQANVQKDPEIAREVLGHLRELLAAWRAISESGFGDPTVTPSVDTLTVSR